MKDLADVSNILKGDYQHLHDHLGARCFPITRELAADEKKRRAALTDDQRRIEDLERQVADLTARMKHAQAALAGDDYGHDY